MNALAPPAPWPDANQRYLVAALEVVRARLERHAARAQPDAAAHDEAIERARSELAAAQAALPAPSALQRLAEAFGLSEFECQIVLLCAGPDLDARFAGACAAASGSERAGCPTFSLALAALSAPHWSALAPAGALRGWRLIEVGPERPLTTAPLHIDERVLHFLTGVRYLDERLRGFVRPLAFAGPLPAAQRGAAELIAAAWRNASGSPWLPLAHLCGTKAGVRRLAGAACELAGLNLHLLPAHAVPDGAAERESLLLLWEREVVLGAGALLVECDDGPYDPAGEAALVAAVEGLRGAVLVGDRVRRRAFERPSVAVDVAPPTALERAELWRGALGAAAPDHGPAIDRLAAQFGFDAPQIAAAAAAAAAAGGEALEERLWSACVAQARPRLDDLAQRVEVRAGWDDLVVPDPQRQLLRDIAVHVRHRATVFGAWAFEATSARGSGISALFSGAPGTGKTMAAEALADELRLDLYRIDLSQVVSKYVGETEKCLRRVFDAADEGGVVLLFDEADALFGKRSEVHDSHDRYANIEVSYLLQRMEAYRGLAVLTTNLKDGLDPAFVRRLRFVVHFPFPDRAQREAIWRRAFPPQTPTEPLDFAALARLNVAGGSIANIALHAAFAAAAEHAAVGMRHLLQAARGEAGKIDKSLTEAEIGGWT